MKKYIVWPGFIYSKIDNDMHFITTKQLMRLYNVPENECYIAEYNKPISFYEKEELKKLIPLTVRNSGLYPDLGRRKCICVNHNG